MGGLGGAIKDQFLKTTPHLTIFLEKQPISFQLEKITQLLESNGLQKGIHSLDFFERGDVLVRTHSGLFSGAIAQSLNPGYKELLAHTESLTTEGDILDENPPPLRTEKPRGLPTTHSHFHKGKAGSLKQKKGFVISWSLAQELDLYEGEKIDIIPAEKPFTHTNGIDKL